MAITITPVKGATYSIANKRSKVFDVTLDSSYPTGGYAFTPGLFGLKSIDQVMQSGFRKSDNSAHIGASLDRTANKLVLFTGGAQVTNATNLSTYSGRVTVIGTGTG